MNTKRHTNPRIAVKLRTSWLNRVERWSWTLLRKEILQEGDSSERLVELWDWWCTQLLNFFDFQNPRTTRRTWSHISSLQKMNSELCLSADTSSVMCRFQTIQETLRARWVLFEMPAISFKYTHRWGSRSQNVALQKWWFIGGKTRSADFLSCREFSVIQQQPVDKQLCVTSAAAKTQIPGNPVPQKEFKCLLKNKKKLKMFRSLNSSFCLSALK